MVTANSSIGSLTGRRPARQTLIWCWGLFLAISEDTRLKLLRFFVLLGLALPAWAQYAGPAILSRGEAPAAMIAPKVDFNFSVAVSGTYTNGLAGVSAPTAQGQLANLSSYGVGVVFGVSGAHTWRHTHLGLNYGGGFSYYPKASVADGLQQGLLLGLTHQFTKHISLSLQESAGWFRQFAPSTVSLNSSVPFDPSQSNIPTTDFYDNRTIYTSSGANLIIQKSARLSLALGGSYFADIRQSSLLYGAKGESATGNLQYRVSRRATIGGGYTFSHYSYTHSFGGAYVQGANVSLSLRLSRGTEFSMYGGASRVESSFEVTVPIDPIILAILCPPNQLGPNGLPLPCPVSAANYINHNLTWSPSFGARFSMSFRRGVAYVTVAEGITPGNGLFLTSRAATAAAGYGYTGLRKWSMNIGVSYVSALSLGNVQGGYGQISGWYGVSRQIVSWLNIVSSLNATQYTSNSFTGYNRLIYSASLGLGYSSHNIPLRFF